jgi:hypothetical protein
MENQETKPRTYSQCRGTLFTDGLMRVLGGIGFSPEPETVRKKLFGPVEQVRAAKCESCGHLELFAGQP